MWNGIKNAITSPIETARNTIKGIVDRMKGFFPLKLSNIFSGFKLPHVKITKKTGILGIPYPSFSVDWYKKAYEDGMRFDSPTVVPTMSGLKGFGDGNGAEWVVGERSLMSMIAKASKSALDPERIYDAVREGASAAVIQNNIDGRELTRSVNAHNTNWQNGNLRFRGAF